MRIILLFIGILYHVVKQKIPKFTLLVIVYFIVYGFSTYINGQDILSLISYATYFINFVIWIEILLRDYTIKGLYSLNFVYSTFVYINLIFFLLFPDGYVQEFQDYRLIKRYFLGVTNQFASFLMPAVAINIVYSYVCYGKLNIRSYLLISIVLFTFIYHWSATSIVGISLIILFLIFIKTSFLKALIQNKIIFPSYIILYFIIVIFRNMEIFSILIENVLKKDLTLSTRTLLWDRAINYIQQSIYFGYGYLPGGKYLQVTAYRAMDAHNTLLQFLIQHGIIGLIPIIFMFFIFIKNTSKFSQNIIAKFIMFSMFVALTMMINEVYSLTYILIMLLLGIYTPNIVKSKKDLKLI